MNTKIIFCAAILCSAICIPVHAQDAMQSNGGNSRLMFGIYGGYSLPMGNITKTDYLDLSAGFAKAGPDFSIDGTYFFNDHMGAGAVVSLMQYGIRDRDILAAGYVEAFAVDDVTMSYTGYSMLTVMPAFYYTLAMQKMHVDFRVMAGYANLTTPKIHVQLEDNADHPLIQNAASGGGFGFGIGAGIRYAITSHIGLALRVDYLNTKPNVDITYTNLNNPTDKFRLLTNYNEDIGSINGTLGLMFTF